MTADRRAAHPTRRTDVKRYEILLLMHEVRSGNLRVEVATNAMCRALNAAYARGAGHDAAAQKLDPRLEQVDQWTPGSGLGLETHLVPVWDTD